MFYGSSMGTSEELARLFVKKLLLCDVKANVMDLQNTTLDLFRATLKNIILVFFVSTTGLGEMPRSMQKLWNSLKQRSCTTLPITFAAFGCGDSSYGDNFNRAIRLISARLTQLGATQVGSIGFGDVQAGRGVRDAFDIWSEEILGLLALKMNNHILPPMLQISSSEYNLDLMKTNAVVVYNERMTDLNHFQDVRIIRFKCEASYEAGDVAVIKPRNDPATVLEVYEFLKNFVRDLPGFDQPIRLTPSRADCPFQIGSYTLRLILTNIFDLNQPPGQSVFDYLATLCTASSYTEKLMELAQDYDLYEDYVTKPRRTTHEVLLDFKNFLNPSFLDLFEIFPIIKPRYFSIASPPNTEQVLELCVARVEYKTILKRQRFGLCSRYLCDLKAGTNLNISVESGTMKVSKDASHFILLGAGTGISPLRSIIGSLEGKDIWLIQGCRYVSKDGLFNEEFKNIRHTIKGSRDQAKKIYLQDTMQEESTAPVLW